MMGLDLKPGDEVITADVCCDCGSDCFIATDSVLVDVDNMNISIDAIRKQLHPKQKQ
jgi:dTDP-4-amino-4,6-dideoxygalactose transaminase